MYAQTREKVSDVKSTAAAAVFLATKECKCDRTIREINKVVDPTRKLKNAMGKASRELTRVMQERLQVWLQFLSNISLQHTVGCWSMHSACQRFSVPPCAGGVHAQGN